MKLVWQQFSKLLRDNLGLGWKYMSQKRVKIQLTLPKDLADLVEKETSENFTSMSLWFEKILRQLFERKIKDPQSNNKKILELDI